MKMCHLAPAALRYALYTARAFHSTAQEVSLLGLTPLSVPEISFFPSFFPKFFSRFTVGFSNKKLHGCTCTAVFKILN